MGLSMISRKLWAALPLITLLLAPLPARAWRQKSSTNDPAPRIIELWPKGAPGATGASDEDKPAITPYLPAPDKNTGAGALICPGGAFTNRAVNHEGVLITAEPRVAVEGIVKVDGEPLPHGYVIFIPLDKNGAPPVTAYVFNTGEVLGRFAIPQNQGLVPGRYSVEVRQNATRWLSNSRNEVIIKMNQKLRNGQVTEADRQEWNDYARKRDLAPNIEGQRVYRHQRPTDKNDLVVEIKSGAENRLQIEVFSR